MTRLEQHNPLEPPIPMPKSSPVHLCPMCGSHFSHLFAYNRHLLRQHWFEAQKEFSEEKLQSRIDGLTDKQSQKLRELFQKLKDRNSPTPPKRSRRSKPASDSDPYSREPRVTNLKEYKLVTVDDMSEAYKDKYNNPGGYTIFHFKVPKKNNPVVSPPLTALKKTYQTSDNKLPQRTEKIPITTSPKLSSWQQQSFQHHLSRGITHNMSHGVNSLVLGHTSHGTVTSHSAVSSPSRGAIMSPSRVAMTPPSRVAMTSPSRIAMTSHMGRNGAHGGCEKCRKRNGVCDNKECAGSSAGWSGYPHSLPLNFSSPLLNTSFNCTDILKKIISSPESISKPEISLTVEDRETKVDVMSISLTPSPSSSRPSRDNSPCSSRDNTSDAGCSDHHPGYHAGHHPGYHATDRRKTDRMLADRRQTAEDSMVLLAQIGLEMVYSQYIQPP